MNGRCWASEALAEHLQHEAENDARGAAIDAQVEVLMAPRGKFCATTAEAIKTALDEAEPLFWQSLAKLLAVDIRSGLVAKLVRDEATNYWTKLALPVAEKDIARERQCCYGRGCIKCEAA